jgi:hypothetical protein
MSRNLARAAVAGGASGDVPSRTKGITENLLMTISKVTAVNPLMAWPGLYLRPKAPGSGLRFAHTG